MNINLDINNALKYNQNNQLTVNISSKSGNTLTLENDGLYAHAIPGSPGSSGTGFPDNYVSSNGIKSGISGPFSSSPVTHRVVAPSIIHRIFTCSNIDGSDISLRSVDVMLPGDMYRVKDTAHGNWNYYIILSVNSTGTAVASHTGAVAVISLTATDVN